MYYVNDIDVSEYGLTFLVTKNLLDSVVGKNWS